MTIMKATDQLLFEIFDKAMSNGVETLSPEERRLYLIQDFILEWENGALTGYFYTRLPNVALIAETIAAMRHHDVTALADILEKALAVFRGYTDPTVPTTWEKTLEQYDPGGQLSELDRQIDALTGYGLPD